MTATVRISRRPDGVAVGDGDAHPAFGERFRLAEQAQVAARDGEDLVANAVRFTPSGGTGLGLAIVKHSLSRHQAQLAITSMPGIVSRFAAHFPASRIAGV